MEKLHYFTYDGRQELGTIAAGESFDLEYIISTSVLGFDFAMVSASISDNAGGPGMIGNVYSQPAADCIPEPGTMLLLGSGLVGLVLRRKK